MWYKSGDALLREIRQTETAPGELALWYIGQCGFVLKYADKVLMIDPVLNDLTGPDGVTRRHYPAPFGPDALAPDWVICTHGHADHLAAPTVSAIAAAFPKARFAVPVGCRQAAVSCGIAEDRMILLEPGTVCVLEEGITLAALSAAHPDHVTDPGNPDMALSYQLELGGIRLVHLGDTYLTETLLEALTALMPPHIFLPPINGDDRFRAMRRCIGNMEAEEAAKLAVLLKADLTIPTHYDMVQGNTVDPLRFAAELRRIAPAARWRIPALGERVLYRL